MAGRATSYWTPEARYDAKGRALLQRAAASGQRTLSSCRESRQRSTPVSEKIRLCSSRVGLTDSPEAPLLGELANEVRLRGCTKTEPDREPLLDSTSPSRLTPCHLPYRGEALAGRFTSYWTPEARYGVKGRALLAGAAASGQRSLSSCRWPRQRSTAASETSCFARPDESWPTCQWLPLWGSWRTK